MTWPPTLADYKADQKVTDDDYDVMHQQNLDAAIAVVERLHEGTFNFDADPLSDLPEPGTDIYLGTIRLAGHWYKRRDTPQGLMQMNDLGVLRVASFDPDIERLLRIGRFRKGMFA
jgi:hypothetical protein